MTLRIEHRHLAHSDAHDMELLGPNPVHGTGTGFPAQGMFVVTGARPGLTISAFDISARAKGDAVSHTHPCISLSYLLEGSGESWLLDETGEEKGPIPLRGGQLMCMIAPHGARGRDQAPLDARFRGLDLRLSTDLWQRMGGPLTLPDAEHPWSMARTATAWCGRLPIASDHHEEARGVFRAITEQSASDLNLETGALSLISAAIDLLNGCQVRSGAPYRDRLAVERACRAARANLAYGWSVQSLAETAGVSKKRFKTIFPSIVGTPCYAWLQEQRLVAARDQLRAGKVSVTEVALDVGYSSPSHFSSAFRRRFGISPSQISKWAHTPISRPC